MGRLAIVLAMTLAGGCAAGPRPLHFPSRKAPAATTAESDEDLLAKGYVCLGALEVSVEKERCRGTADKPGQCLPTDPTTESTGLLLAKAGDRGGDLVRLSRHREPASAPWHSMGCQDFKTQINDELVPRPVATCVPTVTAVIGTRHLTVSSGTIWRREPDLVPNMLLARAAEAGDEARLAETIPRVRNLDAYLDQPPLVIAARKGHAGILRRLLGSGARAGKNAALLAAVGRSDLDMIDQLLAAGADPETIDPATRERPMHVAAFEGASAAVVARLLAAGADVNALDGSDHMPLQEALLGCHAEVATQLIAAGASTSWALADRDALAIARHRCPEKVDGLVRAMTGKR